MKAVTELKFEDLTLEQKFGIAQVVYIRDDYSDRTKEYIYNMIRNHMLGGIWIQYNEEGYEKMLAKVKEIADYPILVFTDAESGIGEYRVGQHNAVGCTGDEKYAYAFGKATAVMARELGYNVVCNPVLDINGGNRAFSSDKYMIAKMAAAEARGMHEGGVLTVGKHYPSGANRQNIDTHMAEAEEEQTEEELINQSLYAYIELMKENLLDGLMSGHHKFVNIDPDYPTSLSKKTLDIIRNCGFDGFFVTDALCMMGIRAKYGDVESKGLALAAGNDLINQYEWRAKDTHEAIRTCYENGIITDERLDEAVKRILDAQHKVALMEETRAKELTEEEIYLAKHINKDSAYIKADKGLSPSISRDGKYFFALMTRNEENVGARGDVAVDTFSNGWLYPSKVIAKINELFPNSTVYAFHQFPKQVHNMRILSDSIDYDDVIFLTFSEFLAYTGQEHLTRRVETLIEALQITNRISTLIHFGNPRVLGNLPHISRCIFGGLSEESVDTCLEILAGEYEAKGVPTYDFKLN